MSSVLNREAIITQIIDDRKSHLDTIKNRRKALLKVSQALERIGNLCSQIAIDGPSAMKKSLRGLDIASLRAKIDQEYQALKQPESRFRRDTLNIGVIGRARQGKSQLLRSLTGLSTDIIPTGRFGHCTGVRSLICHDPGQQPHGEISFYSEDDLLHEMIEPYYTELDLGDPPHSFSSFADDPHPLPPRLTDQTHAEPAEARNHLLKYREHARDYRSLLDSTPPPLRLNRPEEIRAYVAQESVDGTQKYYKYLAVQEAKIICTFGYPDIGRIALIDMPGLGDTVVGAERRLIQTLGELVDFVLFVILPSPAAGTLFKDDFILYDLASKSLGSIPISQWSAIILNRTNQPASGSSSAVNGPIMGDNSDNCRLIQDSIKNGKTGISREQITIIADCNQETEAKNLILDAIITHLATNMKNIDATYLSYWERRYEQLRKEIIDTQNQLASLAKAEAAGGGGDEERIFRDLFDSAYIKLTSAIEGLREDLQRESGATENTFTQYFEEKLEKCRSESGIKELEEIRELGQSKGNGRYVSIFSEERDLMNAHLTSHFQDIDERLTLYMEEVKKDIARVFLDQGQLKNLYTGIPPEQFFGQISKAGSELSLPLRESLEFLQSFQLSPRGYFLDKIRDARFLTPDAAIMRYLISPYISPRLTSLFQRVKQLRLDLHIWEQLIVITFRFILNAASTNPLDALVADINTLLDLDETTKDALVEAMKTLFLAESRSAGKTGMPFAAFAPEQILQALQAAYRDEVTMIEQNLKPLYIDQGGKTIAMVSQFISRTFRAKNAESDWRIFYHENRHAIWKAEFSQTRKWQWYQQRWQEYVHELSEAIRLL